MKNPVIDEWKKQYDTGIEAGEGNTLSDAQYYLVLAQGAAERHNERVISIPDGYVTEGILRELSDRMKDAGIREFTLTEYKGDGILRKIAEFEEEGWKAGSPKVVMKDALGTIYGVTIMRDWRSVGALS